MATKKTAFLRPDIDFSDDDEMSEGKGARLISNKIKKTRTNVNAIKNPNKYEEEVKVAQEEDDDDDEPEVLSDDDSPVRRPNPRASKKRKSDIGPSDKKKFKKSKRSDSDDEFLPEDRERSDDDEDEEEEEDVASEDLSDDFDSDFNPDDEEEVDACQEDFEVPADSGDQGDPGDGATINLSSDGEASPEKKEQRKTFDTNGKEFWDKVQELRSKGFSIQQAGNGATKPRKFNFIIFAILGTSFCSIFVHNPGDRTLSAANCSACSVSGLVSQMLSALVLVRARLLAALDTFRAAVPSVLSPAARRVRPLWTVLCQLECVLFRICLL